VFYGIEGRLSDSRCNLETIPLGSRFAKPDSYLRGAFSQSQGKSLAYFLCLARQGFPVDMGAYPQRTIFQNRYLL
jgi:hypothetical protein